MPTFPPGETIVEIPRLFGTSHISLDDQRHGNLCQISAGFLERIQFLEACPSLPGIGFQNERKLDRILIADFPEPAVPLPFATCGNQKRVGGKPRPRFHQGAKDFNFGFADNAAVLLAWICNRWQGKATESDCQPCAETRHGDVEKPS